MRIHYLGLAFAGAITLTAAGALAQAEAERRLDAAIERLRSAIGPEARITIGRREVDPVSGRARLSEVLITDPETRTTIAEILLNDLAEARLGRAELRQIRGERGKEQTIDLGRLVIGGLPLPAAGQGFDLGSFAIDLLEIEGLRAISAEDGTLSIGRLSIEAYAPGSLRAARVEGFGFDGTASDAVRVRIGRFNANGLAMPRADAKDIDPRSFRAEGFSIEGVELRDPDRDVEMTLGRVVLRDWVPGKLTEFALEGLAVAAPLDALGDGEIRVGRIDFTGIDAATTLAAVLNEVQPPDPVPGSPQRFSVQGLDVLADGLPLFNLGRFATEATLDSSGLMAASLVAEGFALALPPGMAGWLEQVGYRDIRGGLEVRGTANPNGGRLDVEPLRIAWEQAGALTILAQAQGLPRIAPGERADPASYAASLAAGKLAGLTLRWEEAGLLERVLVNQARAQRVSPAQLREQWAQMALAIPLPGTPAPRPQRGRPAPTQASGPDAFTPMREAIARFIRNPSTLEIALRPPTPIAFGEMQERANAGPIEAARIFGLSVTAP